MNKNLCIFFVDDDDDDRELIGECFNRFPSGCEAKLFACGADVLDHLNTLKPEEFPHLIVLDYNMPKTSGLEILRSLKGEPDFRNIPVVFFTTSCSPELERSATENGAVLCLQKATSYKELQRQAQQFRGMAEEYALMEK